MKLVCQKCERETWTLYAGDICPDCFFDNRRDADVGGGESDRRSGREASPVRSAATADVSAALEDVS